MVGDKTIDIPLIALISHHYLAMDNVQIKFKAKVGSVESQIPENNLLLSSPHRANLQMQMSNIKPDADDVMEVCVNFKVQETPESITDIHMAGQRAGASAEDNGSRITGAGRCGHERASGTCRDETDLTCQLRPAQ